jgi:hypothetical protein
VAGQCLRHSRPKGASCAARSMAYRLSPWTTRESGASDADAARGCRFRPKQHSTAAPSTTCSRSVWTTTDSGATRADDRPSCRFLPGPAAAASSHRPRGGSILGFAPESEEGSCPRCCSIVLVGVDPQRCGARGYASKALALAEADLDHRRGALLVVAARRTPSIASRNACKSRAFRRRQSVRASSQLGTH